MNDQPKVEITQGYLDELTGRIKDLTEFRNSVHDQLEGFGHNGEKLVDIVTRLKHRAELVDELVTVITTVDTLEKYVAEECQRQESEPISVYWMLQAWRTAMRDKAEGKPLSPGLVVKWASMIEPVLNANGIRSVPIIIGDKKCPPAEECMRLMDALFDPETLKRLNPATVYFEFELIHPFCDGNGRTGKVIYNYLHNSLDEPTMPPNFFGCSNA